MGDFILDLVNKSTQCVVERAGQKTVSSLLPSRRLCGVSW